MRNPQGIKFTAIGLNEIEAKWEDWEFSYAVRIHQRHDHQWIVHHEVHKKPKLAGKQPSKISLFAEAQRTMKYVLEKTAKRELLDEIKAAWYKEYREKQHQQWLAQQEERLMVQAAPDMLKTLKNMQAYLDRRNDAPTMDELKADVAGIIDRCTVRLTES